MQLTQTQIPTDEWPSAKHMNSSLSKDQQWQLTGGGPESYERYQVPSVFEPLARLFLDRAPVEPGDRVLDVACGTGIVARLVAPIVGSTGRVAAIDLNPAMIDVAKRVATVPEPVIEWHQGDAAVLPFGGEEFDVVLCQQGLQFIPDPLAVLVEMHRVLAPGGWLALCVWRTMEYSPCNLACYETLARILGEKMAAKLKAPFSLGDPTRLSDLIGKAGFSDIAVLQTEITRHMLAPAVSIPGHLASTPVGPEIEALDGTTRRQIVDQIGASLAPYVEGDGMAIPQGTNLVLACK